MNLLPSEKATLNFYEWEYLGRGYYHFNEAVHIEPPYVPFYHITSDDTPFVDDGKVPSLFKRVLNVFTDEKPKPKKEEEKYIIPTDLKPQTKLVGFTLSFPKGQEISNIVSVRFINMLAYSNNVFSFEIVGTADTIQFQIICSREDKKRVQGNLKAYFPKVNIQGIEPKNLPFDIQRNIAIADFGLHDEYMRPLETANSFGIDPLTSIIATLENLNEDESALIQILFKGVSAPWSKDMLYAVSDGQGGSFFKDEPEMISYTKEKVSSPLFACVMRIATQGKYDSDSQYIAQELAQNISSISDSRCNKLIPLSNEDYEYDDHVYNVYHRTSNRLGMILNSGELATFVHYPNKSIVSEKLHPLSARTKSLPTECINQSYILGLNEHNGKNHHVSINDTQRLQHCHIIGATGVGKSTLIAHLILQDIHAGNGCALFDPHGDISEDIISRIPDHRKDDVIFIDPSDTNYPIGFNLLRATTEAEKIVLSSDLVSAFKRYATSWGDNINAVLSNVINTFLESTTGGTLIELKRFLLEESFRKQFLKTVDDNSLHYYWNYEYSMVKKGIAPLLTRIDAFLRPKIIRSMFAQKEGIDFKEAIENKKIIILKLSLGLIGEENSYLLGSLFLSKINQVAHSRQTLPKHKRNPYYIYLDEFHNYITSSVVSMLSGARKYGIGLTMAHQELGQIESPKILNSIISNPYIRICFRLGDNDARKLENGFSFFEQSDVQSLTLGETIIKVGVRNNDCNMITFPLDDVDVSSSQGIKEYIIANTRTHYAKPKEEVDSILNALLPQPKIKTDKKKEIEVTPIEKPLQKELPKEDITDINLEIHKQEILEKEEVKERISKHKEIQEYIRTLGVQRGFKSSIEAVTGDDKKIDVLLSNEKKRVGVEVAHTNSNTYEIQNIQKCIDFGCTHIVVVSENATHLKNIKALSQSNITKEHHSKLSFLEPQEVASFLDKLIPKKKTTKKVRGYRVTSNQIDVDQKTHSNKASNLKDIILQTFKKKRNKK